MFASQVLLDSLGLNLCSHHSVSEQMRKKEGGTLAPTLLPDLSIPTPPRLGTEPFHHVARGPTGLFASIPTPPRLGTEPFHHVARGPHRTLCLGRGCLPPSWLGANSFSALSITSLTAHQSPLDQNETPRVAAEQQHFSSSEEAAK